MSRLTDYTIELESGYAEARVSYETVRGTLVRYSVVLVVWHGGGWRTARIYDNNHGQHDLHRLTLSAGKQRAETFHHGTPSEAFNEALITVRAGYEEMIAGWLR